MAWKVWGQDGDKRFEMLQPIDDADFVEGSGRASVWKAEVLPGRTMANRRKKPRGTTAQPGYWAAKHALAKFGSHVIDGRSRVAHALDQFRDELVRDLGGPEAISKQQEVIVSMAVRTHLLVHSLDNYILSLNSLVNQRKRSVWPVVRERTQLADALARYMGMLGLERRARPVEDLQTYLRRKAATQDETSNTPRSNGPDDEEPAEIERDKEPEERSE